LRGKIERDLIRTTGKTLVGVDEVGRGCLAGPVYAACASLDYERVRKVPAKSRALIRDSKKLSFEQREKALPIIAAVAVEVHVGVAKVYEIERFGIVQAIFLAMNRALQQCTNAYDILLVDGNQQLPDYWGEQMTIVGGDDLCFAIAAAAIVAKQARDKYMRTLADTFPDYGFDTHVGYATEYHLKSIGEKGICPLHRGNFHPITTFGKAPQNEY